MTRLWVVGRYVRGEPVYLMYRGREEDDVVLEVAWTPRAGASYETLRRRERYRGSRKARRARRRVFARHLEWEQLLSHWGRRYDAIIGSADLQSAEKDR